MRCDKMKLALWTAVILSVAVSVAHCQSGINLLANTITGAATSIASNEWVPGIKNILGGIQGLNIIHNRCLEKRVCEGFAPKIVRLTERLDPVKRTTVYVPELVKEEGSFRWIGDLLVNGISRTARAVGLPKLARRLGINLGGPGGFKRRQGLPPSLVASAFGWTVEQLAKIPIERYKDVADLLVDVTNTFDRSDSGTVFPMTRAATLGYSVGDKKFGAEGEEQNVCNQIAPDCSDGPNLQRKGAYEYDIGQHLATANGYSAGALARKTDFVEQRKVRAKTALAKDDNPFEMPVWNYLEMGDLLKPRVLVCKAGRFLTKINGKMDSWDDTAYPKDNSKPFGNSEFESSCDPRDLVVNKKILDEGSSVSTLSDSEVALEQAPANGADIVEAPDKAGGRPAPQRSSSSLHDLPVIVMEGLRTADRTLGENNDRDVVVNELKKVMPSTSDFSQASVVKAIRMPFVSAEGRSIVLVRLDTEEHEIELIDVKKNQTESESVVEAAAETQPNDKADKLSARPRKEGSTLNDWIVSSVEYDELWDFLGEFQVANRVSTVHKVWPQKEPSLTKPVQQQQQPSTPAPLPPVLTLSGNIKVEEETSNDNRDQQDLDYLD